MSVVSKLLDKLYLKQWRIGIANENIENIIRDKKSNLKYTWIPIVNKNKFSADPFIFKNAEENYSILYEDYDYVKQYGTISMCTIDAKNHVSFQKKLLDTNSHLSYPSVFIENNEIFIFPEAGQSGKLTGYQYDLQTMSLTKRKDIIDLPLVDSTLLKYRNKYWIFSTIRGETVNENLHIYYSENLWGPYISHVKNPVKSSIAGSRPAGNLIAVDGNIYRPAQNSEKYYGSSIIINKILILDEQDFKEEFYMEILPNKTDPYNTGIHTINCVNNKVVVDGLGKRFLPITQLKRLAKTRLKLLN